MVGGDRTSVATVPSRSMRHRVSELCGRAGRPPLPVPDGVLDRIAALADRAIAGARSVGAQLTVDPWQLITARLAETGWTRQGGISRGGATRLVATADGWVAVSLARPDDLASVAAWLELEGDPPDVWHTVVAAASVGSSGHLVDRATLLGLAVGAVGERWGSVAPAVRRRRLADGPPPLGTLAGVRVLDLSALWAGPVCAHLVGRAGADVVKVESVHRPDGARLGPPKHFAALHDGHTGLVLDLRTSDGRNELRDAIESADVVIEGSRPRALRQLGIDRAALLAQGAGTGVGVDHGVRIRRPHRRSDRLRRRRRRRRRARRVGRRGTVLRG